MNTSTNRIRTRKVITAFNAQVIGRLFDSGQRDLLRMFSHSAGSCYRTVTTRGRAGRLRCDVRTGMEPRGCAFTRRSSTSRQKSVIGVQYYTECASTRRRTQTTSRRRGRATNISGRPCTFRNVVETRAASRSCRPPLPGGTVAPSGEEASRRRGKAGERPKPA